MSSSMSEKKFHWLDYEPRYQGEKHYDGSADSHAAVDDFARQYICGHKHVIPSLHKDDWNHLGGRMTQEFAEECNKIVKDYEQRGLVKYIRIINEAEKKIESVVSEIDDEMNWLLGDHYDQCSLGMDKPSWYMDAMERMIANMEDIVKTMKMDLGHHQIHLDPEMCCNKHGNTSATTSSASDQADEIVSCSWTERNPSCDSLME